MIKELRNKLERKKGEKANIEKSITNFKSSIKEKKREQRAHEKAREIIRDVGLRTQQELQYHISDITSLALDAVFDDPYELVAEFVLRRNKTECDLYFQRGEYKIDPLTASGVGAVDVASFALRIASWSMQTPRSRNVIVLDEPFKFLSQDKQEQASMMLKEISKKLGIQFIIVTHEEILAAQADKTFQVKMKNKKSKVFPI